MKEECNLNTVIKKFEELTVYELYKILQLRVNVFVVEQNCPYKDIDDLDKDAYHIYFEQDGEMIAYLRVLPQNTKFKEASVGRVISVKRRCGIGSMILNEGIRIAEEKFGADEIRIEAQTYARPFYERAGFVQASNEFLDDGIPHIEMIRRKRDF